MSNEGWICPKCGRVWSPVWPSCSECNAGKRRPFAGHGNPKTETSGALIMLDGDEPEPADAGEGGG